MDPYVVTLHLGLGIGVVIGPAFYISLVIPSPYSSNPSLKHPILRTSYSFFPFTVSDFWSFSERKPFELPCLLGAHSLPSWLIVRPFLPQGWVTHSPINITPPRFQPPSLLCCKREVQIFLQHSSDLMPPLNPQVPAWLPPKRKDIEADLVAGRSESTLQSGFSLIPIFKWGDPTSSAGIAVEGPGESQSVFNACLTSSKGGSWSV